MLLTINSGVDTARFPPGRAVRRGNLAEVKRFLDEGKSIEAVGGRFHGTLLLESCRYHTVKIAILLLERGAATNVSGGGFWTPLHYACDGKEATELVAVLIRHHAEVDAVDFYGRTPLHIASRQASSKAAFLLLKAGAEPNTSDDDGRSPAHYAASHGRREVIELLVGFGGDLTAVDGELETPLHRATREGQRTAMDILVKAGADPDAVNCWGELAGNLAPNCKMNPAMPGSDGFGSGSGAGKGSKPCASCSARKGRHYYFCKSETLRGVPGTLILGPDGLPIVHA